MLMACVTAGATPSSQVDCRAELQRIELLQSRLRGHVLEGSSAGVPAELRLFAQFDGLRAQWSHACNDYRDHRIDAEQYAQRTSAAARFVDRSLAVLGDLDASSSDAQWNVALASLHAEIVPTEELAAVDMRVWVTRREGGTMRRLADGSQLAPGDEIRIHFEVANSTWVYVYQRSPADQIKPLFPHRRIRVRNPVVRGEVSIPPSGVFRVDEQTGPVGITVIAATRQLDELETVLGLGLDATTEQVECIARGVALHGDCHTGRGSVQRLDDGSAHLETLPGEARVVHVFSFEQTGI